MTEPQAPPFWDDLEVYNRAHKAQVADLARTANSVNRLFADVLKLREDPKHRTVPLGDEPIEALRTEAAEAIVKARMLTSFYEVLQLRLLRHTYQDGSQEVPSEGIASPPPGR